MIDEEEEPDADIPKLAPYRERCGCGFTVAAFTVRGFNAAVQAHLEYDRVRRRQDELLFMVNQVFDQAERNAD